MGIITAVMNLNDRQELEKLESVRTFILSEIDRLNAQSLKEKREMRARGEDFTYENPYGAVYSAAEEFRREMESTLESSLKCRHEAHQLGEMLRSPYFGRVDFTQDGCEAENFYIGMRALVDKETYEILIYDWRAPMCSLFYMGETGRASYQAPCGEICGCIDTIRQYKFNDGELVCFWDAQLKIDDSILREVLSASSSEKLRVIVSSIQREQNRAIRYSADKSLCVSGPAGCGKTSVGMHRIAYILYDMFGKLTSDDVLLFTKNNSFLSYVSGILPQLGEDEVRNERFSSLFEKLLPGMIISDEYEQAEAVMNGDSQRSCRIARIYGTEFTEFIETSLDNIVCNFSDIELFGETVISASCLSERYGALSRNLSSGGRLELLTQWASDEIGHWFALNRTKIIREITKRYDIYTSTGKLFAGLSESVRGKAAVMIKSAVPSDFLGLYFKLLSGFKFDKNEITECAKRSSLGYMYFEDAVAVLFIAARLGRFNPGTQPRHILLDEAQDFCPMQHKTLRLLYPKAVFTLLCDTNQAILPEADTTDVSVLTDIYSAELLTLGKSYRATRQLAQFSKRYLDGEDYEVFEREGNEPHIIKCFDEIQQTADIIASLDKKLSSVCVITKTRAEAIRFFGKLSRLTACTLVDDAQKIPEGRVSVMPVILTKGLEFDCVIIPFADNLSRDRSTAYMMTTRALHELYLIEKA